MSGAAAFLLLALLLTAAERWLWRGSGTAAEPRPRPDPGGWLSLLPPPPAIAPGEPPPEHVRRPPETPWVEAPWWELGRHGRGAAAVLRPAPEQAPDSTGLLLARLGLAPDLATRARPDSVLAARLIWLARREGYLPPEIRPLLRSLGRAQAYRAIAARAAEMYDEFLEKQIITSD